jgi:hypothetical protein
VSATRNPVARHVDSSTVKAWQAMLVWAFLFVVLLIAGPGASAQTAATPGQAATQITDPDTLAKAGADVADVVRWLGWTGSNSGVYQLQVQNTTGIGYINSFQWNAPTGLTITAVTSSEGGKCSLANNAIHCSGNIAPPTCTCYPGGSLTVNFIASGLTPTYTNGYRTNYGIVGESLQIQSMTPVPYHIPSYQAPGIFKDIPLCAKGQKSTKVHPCALT